MTPIPIPPASDSVWEAVARWEAAHPGYADDFEPPPRFDTQRDALGDYWNEPTPATRVMAVTELLRAELQ